MVGSSSMSIEGSIERRAAKRHALTLNPAEMIHQAGEVSLMRGCASNCVKRSSKF